MYVAGQSDRKKSDYSILRFNIGRKQRKLYKKQFTTEAQRHREKHFVLLTVPVAQLTKENSVPLW